MTGGSTAGTLQLLGIFAVVGGLPVVMNLIGRSFSESWDDWLDERLGRGSIKDCWPYDRLGRPWRD
jgi:hypothetical protein